MPHLLIATTENESDAVIGGRPMADAGFRWPTCRTCKGHMQYMARLPLSENLDVAAHGGRALLLFQCQRNPGLCNEWDPNAGGNAALIVETTAVSEVAPPEGPTVLGTSSRVSLLAYEEPADADEAQDQYNEVLTAPGSKVIGKAAGHPSWIQDDETPICGCGATMKLAAQLEERASRDLNFGGGGSAYAFVCTECREQARFLWQC